jgi:hypothetical protein
MKTTNHTIRPFPKPARFSLYVCAVVVVCFLNWVAIQAEDPKNSLEVRLAAALVEEVEPEIAVENWMLTFSEDLLAAEEEITLEPWMLTFSDDFIADREPEIEIEPWMLTFSDDYLAAAETPVAVEVWMTDTFLWNTAYLLARK